MYHAIIFTDCWNPLGSVPAIGAYKCAHSLRKNGYSCLVINHIGEFELDELIKLLDLAIGNDTSLIGFSTTFISNKIDMNSDKSGYIKSNNIVLPQGIEFEKKLIQYIQNKNQNIKTVVGGTKANANYSNKNIDYVCLGYSEVSIVNLMDHLVKGVNLDKSHKNIFGRIIIDDRFADSYEFSKEDMIWLDTDVVNHKCLPIEIGRGCIFQCKFCSYPMVGKKNMDYVKSTTCLQHELQRNYDMFGVKNYLIMDDTFNDNVEKLKQIELTISKLTFQPEFWAYIRIDLLCTKPETLDLLYRIGVRAMQFGIETMHPGAAKSIGKGFDRDKIVAKINEIADRYPDVHTGSGFIIGLPGETADDSRETFKKLMAGEIRLSYWNWQPLYLERPGTVTYTSEFGRNIEKYGYVDQGTSNHDQYIDWKSPIMTRDQALSLCKEFEHGRRVRGGQLMTLTTYGIFEWKDLIKNSEKITYSELLKNHLAPKFIQTYKQKLLELIVDKSEFV
jgi:radical SAM superfamily enzyme YgiQ (UPF0313 family)